MVNDCHRRLTITDNELLVPIADSHQHIPSSSCSPNASTTKVNQPGMDSSTFVFQLTGHPKQSLIDGEVWPPIFKSEFVRSAKALTTRDSDVFVCTYPKCGTTWIQHICSQLLNDDYGPRVGHELCVSSPMIERMGGKYVENLTSPRLLKTHFTYENIPKSDQAKYIYAARNPKDCLISYFFHNRNFKIYDFEFGELSKFFELFLTKRIAFGNYFDHLLSWLPHLYDKNVLFLKYEDMCADLAGAVYQIGKFIGGTAARRVEDKSTLEKIVESSTVSSMKRNQWRWFPEGNLRQSTFIRKGGSGDWRNYLSREQSDRINDEFERHLRGTIADDWWSDEMAWFDDEADDDEGIGLELGDESEPLEPTLGKNLPEEFITSIHDRSISSPPPSVVLSAAETGVLSAGARVLDLHALHSDVREFIPWRQRILSSSSVSSLSSGYNSLSSSYN